MKPARLRACVLALSLAGSTAWAQKATVPVIAISDRDVARSAVDGSPDLVVTRGEERIYALEATRQHALIWAPSLSVDASWRQGRYPNENYLRTASGSVDETSFGLLLRLAGHTSLGTTYEVRFENRRDTTSAYTDLALFSPYYRSELSIGVVQPLLRGRSFAENLAPILVARANASASNADERRLAEEIVAQVVMRYYEWAGKWGEMDVRRAALKLAREQQTATANKIRGGALSPLEMAQADATVAGRETELVATERERLEAERELLRLAYLQRRPDFHWDTQLTPAMELTEPHIEASIEDSIQVALDRRPEIRRLRELVNAQEAVVGAARNARLWRLDAHAQVGAVGLAGSINPAGASPVSMLGTQPGTPLPGQSPLVPSARLNGSFFEAIGHPYTLGTFYYLLGLVLEIPLSNAQRNAELEQAQVELSRRKAQLDKERAEISVAVRAAVQQLQSDAQRVRLARESVRLAEVNLDAEQRKFRGGVSTTFDVLRVQSELSLVRLALVRALVQLNIAAVNLQRERSELLPRYDIAIK